MARDWPGTNGNSLSAADAPSFDITGTALTLAAWVRPDAVASNHWVVCKEGGAAGTIQYRLAIQTSKVVGAVGDAGSTDTVAGATNVSTGAWHHAALVKNGTGAGALRCFLDGAQDGSATSNVSIGDLAQALRIGNRNDNNTPFDGLIAEVAIWAAALSADEIASLADGFDPRLVHPYDLRLFVPIHGQNSPENDLMRGVALTVNGTLNAADHTRVYRPALAV